MIDKYNNDTVDKPYLLTRLWARIPQIKAKWKSAVNLPTKKMIAVRKDRDETINFAWPYRRTHFASSHPLWFWDGIDWNVW